MKKNSTKIELIAVFGLVLAALLWGVSYPLTKYVETVPTFYIISIRFSVAALSLAIVFWKSFRNINFATIKTSMLLSFIISLMYIFNIVGVKYTTSVRASFFTCLSFLIVPVINYFIFKIKISKIIVISAFICLIGMFMLCYSPDLGSLVVNLGDILCIGAAVSGAINIIFIEKISCNEKIDSSLFTIFLMFFVALWGTLIALFNGEFSTTHVNSPQLIAILIMGVLCSAAAFALQAHFEAHVPSNRVGVIFSLEPASGCILSVLLLHESMSIVGWLGAIIIMFSILYMEIANNRSGSKKLKGKE